MLMLGGQSSGYVLAEYQSPRVETWVMGIRGGGFDMPRPHWPDVCLSSLAVESSIAYRLTLTSSYLSKAVAKSMFEAQCKL